MTICKYIERIPGPSDSIMPAADAPTGSIVHLVLPLKGGRIEGAESYLAPSRSLRDRLAARGLAVDGLILRDEDAPRPMFAAGAGGQDPFMRAVAPSLTLAADIGAKTLFVPVSWLRPEAGVRLEDHLASWLHALQSLRFSALRQAVEVALEIGPPGPLTTPTETRRFFDDVNSPFIGAAMSLRGDRPDESETEFIQTLTHRLRWIECGPSGTRGYEPAGKTPVQNLPADFAQLLENVRFDGNLVR